MSDLFDYKKEMSELRFTEIQKKALAEAAASAARTPAKRRRPVFRTALIAAAMAAVLVVGSSAAGILPSPAEIFAPLFGGSVAQTEVIDKIGLHRMNGGSQGSAYFFDADPEDNAVQYLECLSAVLPLEGGDTEQIAQGIEVFPGIHHAAGVVGGVDHNPLHMGIQRRLNSGDIQTEGVLLGGDLHHRPSRSVDKDLVLGEVGGDDDKLVAGTAQPLQTGAQRRGGAAGEEQIRPLASGIKPAVQGAGDGVAHLQIPWGAGVGVDGIPAIPGQYLHKHLVHPGGRGDGGVAQGKIQHIFLAHNGGALLSVFKQHPHGVALGPQLAHGL